jgi:2-phospho-L-lactate guanylyltransferase
MVMVNILAIPLRSIADSKTRLAPSLDLAQRKELVTALAEDVICAAQNDERFDEIALISQSDDVNHLAETHNLQNFSCDKGLNESLELYRSSISYGTFVVCHADIGFVSSFDEIFAELECSDIVLCADRTKKGTNLLAHRSSHEMRFSFGDNSLAKHKREAIRHRWRYGVLTSWRTSLDIDTPQDVELYEDIKKSRTNPAL